MKITFYILRKNAIIFSNIIIQWIIKKIIKLVFLTSILTVYILIFLKILPVLLYYKNVKILEALTRN